MRKSKNDTKYVLDRKRGERMNDEQIISAIRSRNQEGLTFLIQQMQRNVYALCYKILGHIAMKEDLEEIVSDVFVSVWEKIGDYDLNKGSLKTWVYIIAKYKALDWKRSAEKKLELTVLNEAVSKETSTDHQIVEIEIDVKEFLKTLTEIDRQLLVRRCFFDEDLEKIALDLHTTRKALDTRIWRIRKNLREFFSKEGGAKHERNRKINK